MNTSFLIESDFLNEHASLRRRIRNLLDGASHMGFYVGAYGLNTFWSDLTVLPGWHLTGGCHIQARLRSDLVYLHTTEPRSGGLSPVSSKGWPTGPALQLPAKPHVFWPSYRVNVHCVTTIHGLSLMTIKPNGHVYFDKPTKGRTLRPGSASWPRG